MGVLDRRVVLVTGKGGVGKTLVATLLALRAARSGRRTLLCETFGARRVPSHFGKESQGYAPLPLAPSLSTLSITSEASIEEYLLRVLRFRAVYEMVFRNRVMGPFMDAVPGLHDLMQLGKVWDLERTRVRGAPEWDLIVVDAPATGHGLTMLDSPRAMMDMTVAGPFHDNARGIAELFEDPARTGIVLVCLPEDMPLRETEQLWSSLGRMQRAVAGIVLNELHAPPVPDAAFYASVRDALDAQADPAGRATLRLADHALGRQLLQRQARERLGALGPRLAEIPFLDGGEIGRSELEQLLTHVETL